MGKKKAADGSNLHIKARGSHHGFGRDLGAWLYSRSTQQSLHTREQTVCQDSCPGLFCSVDNPLHVGFPFPKKGIKEETPYSLTER